MNQQPPPDQDPTRAMWRMSPVADARATGRGSRRGSTLRLGAGIVGGLVMFVPFALVASAFWGWWSGTSDLNGAGWATIVIGLAAGLVVGGFVASES